MTLRSVLLICLSLWIFALAGSSAAQDLPKLTVAYSSRSIAPIDYFIAEQLGYFKAEGLDVRLVQIRASVAVVAMLAGGVDELASISTAISAVQKGAPIKVLAVTLHRPLFWFVARPEFKTISELKGKVVGAVSIGGAPHGALRYMLRQGGLNPDTDVITIVAGDVPAQLQSLASNAIQASAFSPPTVIVARDHFKMNVLASVVQARNGIVSEKDAQEYLKADAERQKLKEALPAARVFDFSLQRDVNSELEIR